jgi:hypothetical protein
MAKRRTGCGCLLGLVFLGALIGGPTIFGKTEDAARTVTAPAPAGSVPSSSVPQERRRSSAASGATALPSTGTTTVWRARPSRGDAQ